MALSQLGDSVVWEVGALDGLWVLGPGLASLGLALALLLLCQRKAPARRHRGLKATAALLFLSGVWWTLGGLGAWQGGVQRLRSGTANVVQGTLAVSADGLRVGDFFLARPKGAFLPALHATRWPDLRRYSGASVRLVYFDADVLRVELEGWPGGQRSPAEPASP